VPHIVDPKPIIEERLRVLAAEHKPRIQELERKIREADKADKPALKKERRAAKRAYAVARRRCRALGRNSTAW
jgi:hypothetical protein